MNVSKILQKWYLKNHRELPWRNTSDPYKIWISEIILQQTRVNQGLAYYHKFIENFPTIFILANSSIEKILKVWQGLGYYSRARNMHLTAKIIVEHHKGIFPQDQKELIKLKGVGEYTSAAIASIAFNKPCAVVDGNVSRVLSRYYGIDIPVNSTKGKSTFSQLANEILDLENPGNHNQAVMELGAIICIPGKPLCFLCPLSEKCLAFNTNSIKMFPQKLRNQTIRDRFFNYLLIKKGTKIFIKQRTAGDIWTMLYEFPLIETNEYTEPENLFKLEKWEQLFKDTSYKIKDISGIILHKLTHQHIHTRFIKIEVEDDYILTKSIEINIEDLGNYAFPRIIDKYLEL